MGGTFINYRRHDERIAFVRTLYARLVSEFGENAVFLDSAAIRHGRRYPNQLRRHLDRSDVVIVVVHPGWATELRTDGADWVHNEIMWALAAGKTIIPLLMDGAKMPRAKELPRTIREFANFQAHRTVDDPGHDRLCEKISGEPRRRAAIGQTPARPWVGPLAVLLGVAAFTAPVLLLPTDARDIAVYASVSATAILVVVMILTALASLSRKQINSAERIAQDFDPTRYSLLVVAPAGIMFTGFSVAIVLSSPIEPQLRPLLVVMAGGTAMYLVFLVLELYKIEKFREDHWPVRLKEPVKPGPVRRELERLLRKHAAGGDPERVRWHITHLENAADVLSRDGTRSRWSWLTADHAEQLLLGTAWSAAAVGLMTSAVLPTMRLWVPAIVLAAIGLIVGLTVETAYRRQLWMRRTVADEVHVRIQRIQDLSP
ncbi:toll/interleukin-1 receptor domain-containing protein [Lentzea sp. BCCO 10_0061]|uniref:Toll/interleukin-1 receptor domain-containing protein n=1 Tax=Lentzea sokolovensis TaxID=3095429 RepID=A0ABU4V3D7_9PSEU|nr:toll/interleukin-1 receptor domain-containing protein [Lentzea sp. BCCO 10_0061]MDX8145473.1 toll/interleukin-1 receptor domain-containing protein [Lentzea sp. BCCO 10_0061]